MSVMAVALFVLPAVTANAAVTLTGGEWTGNSTTFAKGSENARAHYYTYDSLKSALDGYTMYPESDGNTYYMTLSDLRATDEGAWKFLYSINPSQRPWPETAPQIGRESRFLEPDFDDSGWDNMAVPSNWQINWNPDYLLGTSTKITKYDKITYKNNGYGWGNSETINGTNYANSMSNGINNQNAPQNYNGVGTYRRHFTVPAGWAGRTVTLNLDGADGFYVWLNGVPIGYSEDTMTHKEFDITGALNFDGDNIIVVQVIRWTTGSWLEDQDMIRISGIFRDIYLLARRKVDVYDFQAVPAPTVAGGYNGRWDLSVTAFLRDWAAADTEGREGTTVYARLYDAEGNPVSDELSSSAGAFETVETSTGTTYTGWQIGMGYRNLSLQGARRTLNFTNLDVKPWSAEHPNLYKLVLRVGDEYICIRVGFRVISFTNNSTSPRVFINGQRILLHGTNTHELNPYTGRYMPEALIRQNLRIMKENNFNHIRMSHYPHSTMYYDIADEYGIYILDEANLETHQYRNITVSTNSAIWGQAIRDRQVNMYERDKNYACIWGWSLGNESGGGTGMNTYGKDWIRARETSRPIHCEFENQSVPSGQSSTAVGDVLSYMYDTASAWNSRGGSRPQYLCEYSHGEGNSNGNYREYIDVFENNNRCIGGAVWDWIDQSIWTPQPNKRGQFPEVGYLAVGGDWQDTSNDGWFIGDGVLFADGTPKESIGELKYYNQMIRGTRVRNDDTSVTYNIRNKNLFANVNEFDMAWDVTENGVVVLSGTGAHDVGPAPSDINAAKSTSAEITTVFGAIPNPKPGAEYLFNVRYRLRDDTLWAKKGFEIAREQFALTVTNGPAAAVLPVGGDTLTVTGPAANSVITGRDFSVAFTNGVITSYKYKGVEILTSGPVPNFYRGVLDNERAASNVETNMWSWANPAFALGTVTRQQTDAGNLVILTVPNTWSAKNLTATTTYTVYPDGEIKVNETYAFSGAPSSANEVPEIGTIMTLSPGFENLTWYGRGPNDAYVDRRLGVHAGIYRNTVAENFVMYQRSQEMGTKNDTRWLTLTNDAGFGLMVKAGKFAANNAFSGTNAYNATSLIEFNALHFQPWELSRASATGGSTSRHAYQTLDLHANDATYATYLRVNLASTGAGGDNTWGARPLGQYRININGVRTYNYNFSLKPIDGGEDSTVDDANAFWTSARNFYQNIQDYLPIAREMGVPVSHPVYQTAAGVGGPTNDTVAALNAYNELKALAESIEPFITSFKIGTNPGLVDNEAGTIAVSLPDNFGPLTSVTPEIEVSLGATLQTEGALDFSRGPVAVTVVTPQSTKTYTVTITLSPATAGDIIGFTLAGAAGVVDGSDIAVTVPYGTDLADVTPVVFVSAGAAYGPSGAVTFVPGVAKAYSVTSADGSHTKQYSVTVTVAKSTECNITAFSLTDLDGSAAHGVIEGGDITVYVIPGTDLAGVTPAVTVSPGASYAPSGAQTFTVGTAAAYTVTADDGVTTRTYNVTVRNVEIASLKKTAFAAYNTSGTPTGTALTGLPRVVEVVTATGKEATLPAVWGNVTGAAFATVTNASVTVGGKTFTGVKVEVIKPGTVAWINSGTAASGSDLYDAVKGLVGAALVNTVSDKAYAANSWGYQEGSPSAGLGVRTGTYESTKIDTGLYGNTNTAGVNYRYRIAMKAGTYVVAACLYEWWSGPRTTEMIATWNDGAARTQSLGQASVSSSTRQQILNNGASPTAITLAADCELTLTFYARTQNQGPDVAWVQIYQPGTAVPTDPDEITGILTNLHSALYVHEATPGGIGAKLPATVTVSTYGHGNKTAAVVWNTLAALPAQAKAYQTITVTGTATADGVTANVSADIEIVPRGLKYFIDAGSMVEAADGKKAVGSRAWNSVSALVADLLNGDAPDKAKGDGSWGYTTETGAYGVTGAVMHPAINENLQYYKVPNYTDKFHYGWYSWDDANAAVMTYELSLPAGSYMLTTGIHEFWPQGADVARPYTIDVIDEDGRLLATVNNTLSTANGAAVGSRQTDTLFFTLSAPTVVKVSMYKTAGAAAGGNTQPMISWLAVAEQGAYATVQSSEQTASEVRFQTLVENYTPDSVTGNSLLAIYDPAGRLVSTDIEAFTAAKDDLTRLSNAAEAAFGSGYSVGLFVWDDQNNPLGPAAEATP
jgi:beta-galactosidase